MTKDLPGYKEAITYARRVHTGQRDKAHRPYAWHAQFVGKQAFDLYGDHSGTVGVLHDTVEDTGTTLLDIAAEFGQRVADGVEAVTRQHGESYADFIERAAQHPVGRRVKIIDVCHHLMRVDSLSDSRRDRYLKALERLLRDD